MSMFLLRLQALPEWCRNLGFLLLCSLPAACQLNPQDTVRYTSPAGYNLEKPMMIELPPELDEVSGLIYLPKDSTVLAINDELGNLYKIKLYASNTIERWEFSKGGDYEELELLDSTFYVLKSNGDITAVRFLSVDSVDKHDYQLPSASKNEFEILYWDPILKKLMLLCKNCKDDDKNTVSGWTFDPVTRTYELATLKLDVRQIERLLNKKGVRYRPSAAAIHPLTGDVWIVSSVNKNLVIASREGEIKEVFLIDPKLFKQPEGIDFKPDGTMLISNEHADVGLANILVFPYNKSRNP